MDELDVQQTWPPLPGTGKHAGTDTIELIFHRYKQKDRRATYVRALCEIISQIPRLIQQESLQEEILSIIKEKSARQHQP